MTDVLKDLIDRNRSGAAVAIPSVCSAHSGVLRASMLAAHRIGTALVVEATSNQVNQDGGYTGMTAQDFVSFVKGLAADAGIAATDIILGGDHLGPQAWRHLPAQDAMQKAHQMVADYAAAGFTKIHLDCSEGCAGEPAQLPDQVTAQRSAELALTALKAAPKADAIGFVIGTEVPPPGGARLDEEGDIPATSAAAMVQTLKAHADAFDQAGVPFDQVFGLVVQPGVEFSPMQVHAYPMDRELPYRAALADWPGICLEAHSTDYQIPDVYPRLASEGFAFQKVGPALTFAWRQALYALDGLAVEMGRPDLALRHVMEKLMQADPTYWKSHYHGDATALKLARHYGYADRIRYYWPHPKAQQAVLDLETWVEQNPPPAPLLAQGFAPDILTHAKRLRGSLLSRLATAQTQAALWPYFLDRGGANDQ